MIGDNYTLNLLNNTEVLSPTLTYIRKTRLLQVPVVNFADRSRRHDLVRAVLARLRDPGKKCLRPACRDLIVVVSIIRPIYDRCFMDGIFYRIASASSDGTIRLWEVDTGFPISILRAHANWVWHLQFAPASQNFVSGGADTRLFLWDVDQNVPLLDRENTLVIGDCLLLMRVAS